MITRRIYDVMTCNNVLTKLVEQQINFSINIAYKLHKLKNELDEIEQLIFQRWELLFGENFDTDTFTQEEITAYNLTLEAEVNIDIYDLKIDDIISNKQVKLTIDEVGIIDKFLEINKQFKVNFFEITLLFIYKKIIKYNFN